MTGRDLIIYILSNGLEDEELFKNGRFLGALPVKEAAAKMEVGAETIKLWASRNMISNFKIGNEIYIPVNVRSPMDR